MGESIKSKYTPVYPHKYKGNSKMIICRSSWERKFCQWCDMNNSIVSWASEEFSIPFKKGSFPFLANGKSQTMSNTFGFVKTLFNSETGEFLGAHLIGPDVTEMISTFGLAISSESTEDEFINTVFAHPTLSESIHESVLSAFGKPLHF